MNLASVTGHIQVNLDMTDHCTTDDMLGPSPMHIKYVSYVYNMTDFPYDGPIFLVSLSQSYPSSPVFYKSISLHCHALL